jgi:hypothetical protein
MNRMIYLCNMVVAVVSLVKKWHKAKDGVEETRGAYEGLSRAHSKKLLKQWRKLEETARTRHGDALKIYDICLDQGIHHELPCMMFFIFTRPSAAPSKADIQLMLTTNEKKSGLKSGSIGWLATGINLEDVQ